MVWFIIQKRLFIIRKLVAPGLFIIWCLSGGPGGVQPAPATCWNSLFPTALPIRLFMKILHETGKVDNARLGHLGGQWMGHGGGNIRHGGRGGGVGSQGGWSMTSDGDIRISDLISGDLLVVPGALCKGKGDSGPAEIRELRQSFCIRVV